MARPVAAPAAVSARDGKKPPRGVHQYTVEFGDAALSVPLNDLLGTMSVDEVALLTAPRVALAKGWPAGGPLSGWDDYGRRRTCTRRRAHSSVSYRCTSHRASSIVVTGPTCSSPCSAPEMSTSGRSGLAESVE